MGKGFDFDYYDNNYITRLQKTIDSQYGIENNGKIEKHEKRAIEIFKQQVQKDRNNNLIDDETFDHAMGLYITNPMNTSSTSQNSNIENTNSSIDNSTIKQTKKYLKDFVNNNYKTNIAYQYRYDVTLDNILEKIEDAGLKFVDENVIQELSDLKSKIESQNLNNKIDIEKLEEKLGNGKLTKLQEKVLDDFITLAERKVINTEYQTLLNEYNSWKNSYAANKAPINFKELIKKVEEKFKDKNFYDASWQLFNTYVEGDSFQYLEKERKDNIENSHSNRLSNARQVKRYHFNTTMQKGDKITKQNIRKDKDGNRLEARIHKYEKRLKELQNISLEDIKKDMDNKTFKLINEDYQFLDQFKNDDGNTYDLTPLAEAILAGVGDDYLMNTHSTKKLQEIESIKTKLRDLYENMNFENNHTVNELRRFCHIEKDNRDRNIVDAESARLTAGGLAGGIAGATLQSEPINILVNSNVNIKNLLTINGIPFTESSNTISITQDITYLPTILESIAAAGIGVATSVALKLIIGDKRDELPCWDTNQFDPAKDPYKDITKYSEHVRKNIKNQRKAQMIIDLAELYHDKYGDAWAVKYHSNLLSMGGNSILNCKEVRGGTMQDNVGDLGGTPENMTIYTGITPATEGKKEYEIIDATTSSWAKLIEQYPCLENIEIDASKYPNCARRKSALPIRMLKVAQAITDGDYSKERLLYLAEETFKSPDYNYESLKNEPGINHDILKDTMKAELMSNEVKMPNSLAGCAREVKDIKATVSNKGGTVKRDFGCAEDTLAGTSAKYGYRVGNGDVVTCSSEEELNQKVEEEKAKPENSGKKIEVKKLNNFEELTI